MIERDNKKVIDIIDGHNSSSYFWIYPVKILDFSDTGKSDNVAEMISEEISIEEDDISQYLWPFLSKHYDNELEANKNRVSERWEDENGRKQVSYCNGFEWNLTYNFYTYDAVRNIINDINDTIEALSWGRETEYTGELKVKRGSATHKIIYARNLTKEEIDRYNANRPKEDDTPVDTILDFYRRFVVKMEYMMKSGLEEGFDLISFMGP